MSSEANLWLDFSKDIVRYIKELIIAAALVAVASGFFYEPKQAGGRTQAQVIFYLLVACAFLIPVVAAWDIWASRTWLQKKSRLQTAAWILAVAIATFTIEGVVYSAARSGDYHWRQDHAAVTSTPHR